MQVIKRLFWAFRRLDRNHFFGLDLGVASVVARADTWVVEEVAHSHTAAGADMALDSGVAFAGKVGLVGPEQEAVGTQVAALVAVVLASVD